MASGQHSKAEQQRGGRATRRARPALRAHPLFVPILAVWGALLGGLVTFVLPTGSVLAAAANIGLGAFDELSRFALVGLAALGTGGLMLMLGMALTSKPRTRKDTPSIAAMAVRHVRTIDPASELGSVTFDAPVVAMPFSSTDNRAEPAAAPATEVASAPQPATATAPVPLAVVETTAPEAAAPLALDLAQFAALPGRNAVWVEEPVEPAAQAAPAPEPATPARRTAPRPAGPSAIERLRAVPTSELSLIQMVERFAAAVHEHQSVPTSSAGLAARDAALAEALRALAALSRESEAQTQGEPLREALGRLQELRGAA